MIMDKKYTLQEENILCSFRTFLKNLLKSGQITALLVQLRSGTNHSVMPALVSDPQGLDRADPLSPSFQLNGAKLVSRLTRRESDEKIAAVLRPCEVRAFVELVKINQACWDNLVILSADCAGAFSNRYFSEAAGEKGEAFTLEFIKENIATRFDMGGVGEEGRGSLAPEGGTSSMEGTSPVSTPWQISTACKICDHPFPDSADIAIHYFASKNGEITVVPGSEKGVHIMEFLEKTADADNTNSNAVIKRVSGETGGPEGTITTSEGTPEERGKTLQQRRDAQKSLFDALYKKTSGIPDLSSYFSSCVNCYNCRVACPVCFCKECVFNTDVVDYDPFQYAAWAKSRGILKMPVDTLFFHMTRMIHMGLSCVGCGQCSNACPNDIPLAELFKMVGLKTQKDFGYVPGRDVKEPPPLSVFNEDEFQDVTGLE